MLKNVLSLELSSEVLSTLELGTESTGWLGSSIEGRAEPAGECTKDPGPEDDISSLL